MPGAMAAAELGTAPTTHPTKGWHAADLELAQAQLQAAGCMSSAGEHTSVCKSFAGKWSISEAGGDDGNRVLRLRGGGNHGSHSGEADPAARVRPAATSGAQMPDAEEAAATGSHARESGMVSGRSYDVLISHAAPQKASFAVWVRRELQRHGVSAFMDEYSLRYGDTAADGEMEAALRSCSIVVVVLTLDYLRSDYCMQELHWALHPFQPHPAYPQLQKAAESGSLRPPAGSASQRQSHLQALQQGRRPCTVLPVLYQNSVGTLQQEMQQQLLDAHKDNASSAVLRQLEHASSDLDAVCGQLGDQPSSRFTPRLDDEHVDSIVAEVLRGLDRPSNAVDLDARTQELLPLLQPDQPGGVRVLSLHGMGGIGKTTLARQLFESLISVSSLHFSSCVFLEVGQNTPLMDKQRQLISALASGLVPMASSALQQQQQLNNCMQEGGPLLLVLDDIWNRGQRDGLLCPDALPDGSRVILTGRDSGDLMPDNPTRGWAARPVEALAQQQAEQLLCRHAFASDKPPTEYATAVQRALAVCSGLPLALQIAGAGMRSLSPAEAEDAVDSFLLEPHTSSGRTDATGKELAVLTLLQWSFDRLPSDDHRHFFLDAALLMRGHPVEHLLQAWAGIQQQDEERTGTHPRSTPELLRRRAEALWSVCVGATLLSCRTSEGELYSRVQAHDCIVEMAEAVRSRQIAHPACWSLSRLSTTAPLPQADSLQAQASRLQCGPPGASGLPRWTVSQLLARHQQCQLAALDLPHWPDLPAADRANPANSSAHIMPSRLLYLRLAAAPQQWNFGGQLRVLDVTGHSASIYALPDSIAACSELRHLRLSDGQLRSLPASISSLIHLEALLLRNCSSLVQLPDSVTHLHRLVHLDLAKCSMLPQLPHDIGQLSSLQSLDVSHCAMLQRLPVSISSLSQLRMLDVRSCTTLQTLPDSIGSLSALETLGISGCTALQLLPASICDLCGLETVDASRCLRLQSLPHSLGKLCSLEVLKLDCCGAMRQLPDSIGSLASLRILSAVLGTALQQLPSSIGSLTALDVLDVSGCSELLRLPDSISTLASLETLIVSGCKALRQLPNGIGSLYRLMCLDISGCTALQQLPDSISGLHRLKVLNSCHCTALQQLPESIGSLSNLETLDLSGCKALQQLPDSLGDIASLVLLRVHDCVEILRLPLEPWLPGTLAAADVGTALVINPTGNRQADVEQLRVRLLAAGYMCSIDERDMLVFEYVGLVGEQALKDAGCDEADVLRLRGGGTGKTGNPQLCSDACSVMKLSQWQPSTAGPPATHPAGSPSGVEFNLLDEDEEQMQLIFTQPLKLKRGFFRSSVAAEAVVSVQLAACSEGGQTCIQLQGVRAYLQPRAGSAQPSAGSAADRCSAALSIGGGMLNQVTVEFCAGTKPVGGGSSKPVWRKFTTINPAMPDGVRVLVEAHAEGNYYRVKETKNTSVMINPSITADAKSATGTGSAVSAGVAVTRTDGDQPEYAAGCSLKILLMKTLAKPVVRPAAASPATLRLTRNITHALMAGERDDELLGIQCGDGTTLVLGSCGPAQAANTVVYCNVAAKALLLPDVAQLLGKNHVPNSVKIAKVERTAVPISFDGHADLAIA